MKAVVLAGGLGTRLRPLTLTTPKQMLPVVDRPMIEHVLAGLARAGVDGAVLSLGYRPEAFQAAYPGGVCAGVELSYAVEPQPLGTAGAIRFAAAAAGLDETFLAVNGDVISDLDVGRLQDRHRRWRAEATIQLVEVDDPSRYGLVVADDDGRVRSFTEKPSAAETPVAGEAPVAAERPGVAETSGAAEAPGGAEELGPARARWVNAGIYVLEPSVLDRIDADRPVSIERDTFPELAAAGTLRAVDGAGYWIDIGTPQSYLAAQLDLIDGTRGPALPGVAASAVVDPGAAVEHSVVMDGARVGAGAVVRNAAVQAGASVEPGAVVADSVIGPGAVVGAGARVTGGSVVGPGAAVEPGASLSGTRTPDDRPEDG